MGDFFEKLVEELAKAIVRLIALAIFVTILFCSVVFIILWSLLK